MLPQPGGAGPTGGAAPRARGGPTKRESVTRAAPPSPRKARRSCSARPPAERRPPDGEARNIPTSHCMMEEKMTTTSSSEQPQAPERRSIDQSKIAYQKPQAAGMVPDVFVGSALELDGDEREWVPQSDTVAFRPLVLNVSQGYYINILRVRSSGVLSRHRHSGPVHAFTLRGRWRYLEHDWVATPGDYAFEPPGET